MSGIQLRSDALTILDSELKHGIPPYSSAGDFIAELLEILLTKLPLGDTILDCETARKAVEELREYRRLNASTTAEGDTDWIVIKNVDTVYEKYGHEDDDSEEVKRQHKSLTASQFSSHYNQLITVIKKLPVFERGQFHLATCDELNCYDSSVEFPCILFGMLRRNPERILEYLIEDSTGKVPATLDPELTTWREWASFDCGLYLAEGVYDAQRDSFLVKSLGLPPPIASMLPSKTSDPNVPLRSSMVIIIAQIHLDVPRTLDALKMLFAGYSQADSVPEVFILAGNFTSKRVDRFEFKDHMKHLIKLIGTFKRLANQSRFVFVPGPDDHTPPGTTATHDIHQSIVGNHFISDHFPTTTKALKHYFLATNPFQLQIQGRNLCFYGTPFIHYLQRNTIHSELVEHYHLDDRDRAPLISGKYLVSFLGSAGKLVVSGAHLQAGINRSYLHHLSLFPRIPEVILYADPEWARSAQVPLYDGAVQFATMAPFSGKSRDAPCEFLCYYVDTNELEESQILV